MKYHLIVETGEEGLWGYFPDLPGCTTAGSSLDEIQITAAEALDLYFEDHSGTVPAGRELGALTADPEHREAIQSAAVLEIEYHGPEELAAV